MSQTGIDTPLSRHGDLAFWPWGATWPDRCVLCGAPAKGFRIRVKTSHEGAKDLTGVLAPDLKDLLDSKHILEVGLCERHQLARRREPWIAGGTLLTVLAILTGILCWKVDLWGGLIVGAVLLVPFTILFFRLILTYEVVRTMYQRPDGLVLRVGAGFLATLPPYSEPSALPASAPSPRGPAVVGPVAPETCQDCLQTISGSPCLDGYEVLCMACHRKRVHRRRMGQATKALVALVVLGGVGWGAWYEWSHYVPPFDYKEHTPRIQEYNQILEREPCDRPAILKLAETMMDAGDNRGTVDRTLLFIHACGEYPRLRWLTFEGYKRLSEWDNAAAQATVLIEDNPYDSDFRWWRGRVWEEKGDLDKAAADYQQAILLQPSMTSIPINLADVEEQRGRPCDAIFPLEQLLYYHEGKPGTEAIRRRVESLYQKGDCGGAEGSAHIPFSPGAGILTNATLSSAAPGAEGAAEPVTGRFIVDTGASTVVVTQALADRLGLQVTGEPILLETASSQVTGRMAMLGTVKVQGLIARRVPTVVLPTLPDGVDGLLGLSFLSRFDLMQTSNALDLKAKKQSR